MRCTTCESNSALQVWPTGMPYEYKQLPSTIHTGRSSSVVSHGQPRQDSVVKMKNTEKMTTGLTISSCNSAAALSAARGHGVPDATRWQRGGGGGGRGGGEGRSGGDGGVQSRLQSAAKFTAMGQEPLSCHSARTHGSLRCQVLVVLGITLKLPQAQVRALSGCCSVQ